jgi:PAS domain S-box-containing protein
MDGLQLKNFHGRWVQIVLLAFLILPMAAKGETIQPPLRVGIAMDMPPFSFYDQKVDRYRGFCVDLSRLLGASLHRSVRFFPMSEPQLQKALSSRAIDMTCGQIDPDDNSLAFQQIPTTINIERGFFVNKSCLTITCAKDLSGQVVVIESGRDIYEIVEDPQTVEFIETWDQREALDMISTGFAKAFISSNAMTTRYLIQKNKYEDIKEVGVPAKKLPLSIIIHREDTDLVSQINLVYGKIREGERYRIILDKWFGSSFALRFWDRYMNYLVAVLALTCFVLITFILLSWSLKRRVEHISNDLRLSEMRYRELFESSPDMITIADARGNIVFANQRTRELLGYPLSEIAKFNMVDLVTDANAKEMRQFISNVFKESRAQGIFEVKTMKGVSIYLEIMASKIEHEAGGNIMACFFCRDITPRKRLEDELIQTERMAVMGKMAAGLAHEINNPLGIILANTEEVLNGDTDKEDIVASMKAIERNAMRAAKIIENLLSFTKPGDIKMSQVDAVQLIEESIFFLRQKLKKVGITIETQFEKSPFIINADENQFQQLVINLMLNSIEAMPLGGTLNVGLATVINELGPSMALTVKDDGAGIPPEELSSIFNPFFTARKRKGFGLGLFISKRIVENHNGSITVADSKLGEGTTIRVELPLSPN